MRKRAHRVANFVAFNLLFFALYLNFIYKDPAMTPGMEKPQHEPAAFGMPAEMKSSTDHHLQQDSVRNKPDSL